MENNYENLSLTNKYKISTQQMVIENNITLEASELVSKVLSINSKVDLDNSIETLKGECSVTGKIINNIVYVTENGEINNQNTVAPFATKISNENLDLNSKVDVSVRVVNTELAKEVGNQLKVLTTLDLSGVVVKNLEQNYLKEVGDNIFAKQIEQEVVSLKNQNCEKFEENLEVKVKDGVKKILMTNVDVLIKDWSVGTNYISVEGEVYAKILYANNQEISELQTVTIAKPFKQEIEVEGVNKEFDIDVFSSIINEKVQVEIDEKENKETIINILAPILICFDIYECRRIMSMIDAYSTESVINLKSDEVYNYKNCKPEFLEGKIEGNIVLSDNEPRVDKYLAVTNVCASVSNSYVDNGVLYAEGIVSANIIYLNDELGTIQSVQIEMPYIINKNVELENDVILQPSVCVDDVDVMVKRGREIYFDAKVKLFVNVSCKSEVCVISNIEEISKLPEKDSAIEIYFAKAGDSVWDIAKNLKIPAEVIVSQNPNICDPLEKDENITIYFQKLRKYSKNN